MTDLLIMKPLLQSVHDALEETFTVHKLYEADDATSFLTNIGTKIKGVATDGHTGCPPEILNKLPKLEIISSFGVGYDAIDTEDCRARGIRVTNTPDVLTDAVAEITLGLMLALCRRIPQADQYVRGGRWHTEGNFGLTGELTGKTLGILGLGRIGKEVGRRAQAFKMNVVYHGRTDQPHEPLPYFADLTEMAKACDWLVSIVPGGAATNKLINKDVMEALGPEGMLVNVGRGATVDEEELIKALQDGRLGGAALDVFEDEPRVPEVFYTMDNVVLSPHQGSATHKTRWAMGDLVVRNLRAHFQGLPTITPVV
ncbi:MAG: 2-hydroxyacid dehydrogenase [Pseudomonadota bacterium]